MSPEEIVSRELNPEKPAYRHVGIARFPVDDKTVNQDLETIVSFGPNPMRDVILLANEMPPAAVVKGAKRNE